VTLFPARLEPRFVPRIWGVRSLAPLFPEKSGLAETMGEVWMTGNDCRFATGPFIGKTLAEAWPTMPPEWKGQTAESNCQFPLLVKFLFPGEKLSVQVHPHDDYARAQEAEAGGTGKTEMWYALAAQPGAGALVNFKSGTTPSSFRRAVADGTPENSLEYVPIQTGDAIFVPGGTVHTISPGVVLCEIQQNSDITYRVYDYNRVDAHGRLRPLHLEKALAVMNFGEQRGVKLQPAHLSRGAVEKTFYMACRYFAAEKWEFSERIVCTASRDHFDLLIVLHGSGALEAGGQSLPYAAAEVWLVPAALATYAISPESATSLLRTYVPGTLDDFARCLTEQGVAESDLSRLVYP
jgi:mannose-6-phosphate isomerase